MSFVNQLDYGSQTGGITTLTTSGGAGIGTLALTIGNTCTAVIYGGMGNAGATNLAFADSLSNVWTFQTTANQGSGSYNGLGLFTSTITTGGTASFTASGTGGSLYAICVRQDSGLGAVERLLATFSHLRTFPALTR